MELSIHKVAKIESQTRYFDAHFGEPFVCRTLAIHDTNGQVVKLHLYASDISQFDELEASEPL